MLRVVVLGAAAGGGVPQWNCGCAVCRAARDGRPELQSTQSSVAVSVDETNWFLINASPDIRQQITATRRLHPRAGALRHSPIAGVILTNGEVDAVAGLLSLRESSPFTIYAHSQVLAILASNSIFNVLNATLVRRKPIAAERAFEPLLPDGAPSGLEILPFIVPGKRAWYLEGRRHPGDEEGDGDTLGLRIADKGTGRFFFHLAACARMTPDLARRIEGAPLALFDGTVWRDDELIAAGLGHKTAQAMGHIAMSGASGAIAALAPLGIARKLFLHINNSNRALLPDTPEREAVRAAGWELASDGMEIVL
ncbi:MAG: pyrroloquinoline quinone biosynthesis protein PqqB [Xanthobacteraceae bacterium]|nr:pyrroloquinoline quinone biosynthesis protein PqqB [Xanthobacteraceae bacterium]